MVPRGLQKLPNQAGLLADHLHVEHGRSGTRGHPTQQLCRHQCSSKAATEEGEALEFPAGDASEIKLFVGHAHCFKHEVKLKQADAPMTF